MTTKRELFDSTFLRTLVAGAFGVAVVSGFAPGTPLQVGAAWADEVVKPVYTAPKLEDGEGGGGGAGGGGAGGGGAGGGGAGGGGGGGAGGGGAGGGGHDDGGHDDGDHDDGDHDDGDGEGGGNGAGAGADNRPDWAQEGIPEVELGRLNVARSPAHVLEQALAEALSNLTQDQIDFLNLSLEEILDQLANNFDNLSLIDSPLENLGLLMDMLDGTTVLSDYGVTNDIMTLMAVAIGLASDKTVPVTVDTVVALTTIMGTPITGSAAEQLAEMADAVRAAALEGHG